VGYGISQGPFSLKVYNTAGEFIKDLGADANPPAPTFLKGSINQSFFWKGNNYGGNACVSGVYILNLIEPFDRKRRKVLLIH
jgi:hypothetical protein